MRTPTVADWFHLAPALVNIGVAVFFMRFIKKTLRGQERYVAMREEEEAAARAAERLRNTDAESELDKLRRAVPKVPR